MPILRDLQLFHFWLVSFEFINKKAVLPYTYQYVDLQICNTLYYSSYLTLAPHTLPDQHTQLKKRTYPVGIPITNNKSRPLVIQNDRYTHRYTHSTGTGWTYVWLAGWLSPTIVAILFREDITLRACVSEKTSIETRIRSFFKKKIDDRCCTGTTSSSNI